MVISYHVGTGNQTRDCERTASTLNCWVISYESVPMAGFLILISCSCTHLNVCGGWSETLGIFSHWFFSLLHFETVSHLNLMDWPTGLASKWQRSSVSISPVQKLQNRYYASFSFHMGTGDLNSGAYACITSILLTESLPQSLIS